MLHPVNYGKEIPVIVSDSLAFIEKHGIDAEGIFRLSGSKLKLEELRSIYDKGEVATLTDDIEVHAITGLLKQFIRELPDPIFPFNLYNDVISCFDSEKSLVDYVRFKELLKKLPIVNRKILFHLFKLLKKISLKNDVNKMPSPNIAIVWAPNLIQSLDESPHIALVNTPICNSIIKALIDDYEKILDESVMNFNDDEEIEVNNNPDLSTSNDQKI